ncbi:MAG: response regulator [Alphaproteobacteria bacterium]|nr:response regulator [Alphaproteobacteria bacterium]
MPLRLISQPASRLVPVVGVMLALTVLAFQGIDLARNRRNALQHAERLSASLAGMAAEHFARTFEGIDRTLAAAADAIHDVQGSLPTEPEARRQRAHEMLRAIHGGTPALVGISWVDAAGDLVARSVSAAPLRVNNATQPAYAAHRDQEIGLFIGEPVRSLVDGRWLVLLSRRLTGPDQQFLGVVVASLNLDHLAQTFGDLRFAEGGVVSMFTSGTGRFLLFGAETRSHLGRQVTDIDAFRDAEGAGNVVRTRRVAALDGELRVLSYRRVGEFPLVAAVGFTFDGILSAWSRDLGFAIGSTLLLALVLSSGGIALGRLIARRERDVTARRTADIANRARAEFLATVSHEIRTPLNGIIGYAELLADTNLAAMQRHHVEIIDASARALLDLLNDVLDFSRIEAGRLPLLEAPLDIREIVDGAVSAIRVVATRKGLSLDVDAPPSIPRVVGDAGRVRQILLNLLGNAIKFTTRGGVRLAVEPLAAPPDRVRLRITVADTGLGIAPEAQARLFERFAQADSTIGRRFGGTGLGLAISKALVEMMGGTIGVASRPSEGSTFWFTLDLPAAGETADASDAQRDDRTAASPARSLRVLVVDDMDVNRELASTILRKAGHEVEIATNGAEAVERVRTRDFDVVLMDVNMPVMDGFEATARIRSLPTLNRRVRIAALTASATAGDIMRCRQVGMDAHVAKPIDRRQLLQAIESRARWPEQVSEGAEATAFDDSSSDTLDGAHLEELERYLGVPAVAGLATMAVQRIAEMEPRVIALVAARDWPQLAREAHAIVSIAGNLGARALSTAFRRIEVEAGTALGLPDQAQQSDKQTAIESLVDEGLTKMRITAHSLRDRYVDTRVRARS